MARIQGRYTKTGMILKNESIELNSYMLTLLDLR